MASQSEIAKWRAERQLYRAGNMLYTEEHPANYHPGGFHPIVIDDDFDQGRYTISSKLGRGESATVWLARDNEEDRWVSIKIYRASGPKAARELQMIQALASRLKDKPESRSLCKFLRSFVHHGPNGAHHCLVSELLGPSLRILYSSETRTEPLKLLPETVLRFSKQLLQAVDALHRAGCAHGGMFSIADLNLANVAFSCPKLATMDEDEIWDVIGGGYTDELTRVDGQPLESRLPSEYTQSADWEGWDDQSNSDLRLLDFGESFLHGAEPDEIAQPPELRVPEIIFTKRFDYRVDLWCTGAVIYAMIFNSYPFFSFGDDEQGLIAQTINFVEELPPSWYQQWEKMPPKWGKKAEASPIKDPNFKSEVELDFATKLPHHQLKCLLPVIQGLMRFLPSERMSASQALDVLSEQNEGK